MREICHTTSLARSGGVRLPVIERDQVTPASLIKSADALLYLAKQRGRNRWCSTDE